MTRLIALVAAIGLISPVAFGQSPSKVQSITGDSYTFSTIYGTAGVEATTTDFERALTICAARKDDKEFKEACSSVLARKSDLDLVKGQAK